MQNDEWLGTRADDTRNMPHWITHKDQRTKENRLGCKPINPCEFVFTATPPVQELTKFIAQQMHRVKRKAIFHGDSFGQLEALAQVAILFKPWQFKWMCQNNSEVFEAEFICVGEWIAQGKYVEGLK